MNKNIDCMGCKTKVDISANRCPSCDTEVELSIRRYIETEKTEATALAQKELATLRAEGEENDKIIAMLRERLIEVEGEETRHIDEVQRLRSIKSKVDKKSAIENEKLSFYEKILYTMAFVVMVVGMTASVNLPLTGLILAVGALLITPKVNKAVLAKYEWLRASNLFLISYVLIIAGLISVNGFVTELQEVESQQNIKTKAQDTQQPQPNK